MLATLFGVIGCLFLLVGLAIVFIVVIIIVNVIFEYISFIFIEPFPFSNFFTLLLFGTCGCVLFFLGIKLVDTQSKNKCIEEYYITSIDNCVYQSSNKFGSNYTCDIKLSGGKIIKEVYNPHNGPFCAKYECIPGKLFSWEVPDSCEK